MNTTTTTTTTTSFIINKDNNQNDINNNTITKRKKRVPKHFKSLLCVFLALKGTQITIYLRSNCEIYGTIENVDRHLNIELINATITSRFGKDSYELLLVQSRNIRYIQIPDKIDLNHLLYIYSKTLSEVKRKNQRTLRKAPPSSISQYITQK